MREQILAVQRMQDYIEENLENTITLFIPYGVKFRELRKDKINMENLQSVFVQVIHKNARKVIIKREVKAEDYFSYCEEVG